MKPTLVSLFRPALLALGCVLVAASLPSAQAEEKKLPALPITATFEKSAPGENGGPYSAILTNTSDQAVKVAAVVHYSVVSHPSAKSTTLPAQTIEPGKSWTISDLAVDDKVMLAADGYEALVLKVPPGKK